MKTECFRLLLVRACFAKYLNQLECKKQRLLFSTVTIEFTTLFWFLTFITFVNERHCNCKTPAGEKESSYRIYCFQDGRLLELGAYSKVDTYSN